jgi:Putative beta-lactamase-inhibitor-like, PepSY-like
LRTSAAALAAGIDLSCQQGKKLMRSFSRILFALLLLVSFVSPVSARDDEEKVPLDKLPKAVLDGVKAKFPAAELKGASKETENGKTSYEVSLQFNKANHDVILTPEGKITAIEKVIPETDLPKVVAETLKAKYPQATVKTAEQISDADDKIAAYEVLLVLADKKGLEVKFDPNGKVLNEEKKGKD